jgi:hypothetical protein
MNTDQEPTYLHLTPTLRVCRCDDRNFELEERREVTSRPNRWQKESKTEEKWVSVGYASSLENSVHTALRTCEANISKKEKMTLESAIVELKEISEDLKKSVRESGIKVTDFVKLADNRGRKAGEVRVAKVKEPTTEKAKPVKKRGRGRPRKVVKS